MRKKNSLSETHNHKYAITSKECTILTYSNCKHEWIHLNNNARTEQKETQKKLEQIKNLFYYYKVFCCYFPCLFILC